MTPSSLTDARHAVMRTGFAEPVPVVHAVADAGIGTLLFDRLEAPAPVAPLPPPAWTEGRVIGFGSFADLPEPESRRRRLALRRRQIERVQSLRAWWLSNLVATDNPLGARMTLFWQNHFTSSARKVRYAHLMYRQHRTLMTHAMGNFRTLLSNVLRDPAMLLYLDNNRNRRNRLNENLARELLELFTLGEGADYTERDVREVARALTGLGVDEAMEFAFRAGRHDAGEKTIFGEQGPFDVDALVDLLLERPATAEFIAHKLWLTFVSPEPPSPVVRAALGAGFRATDYDLRALLGTLLAGDAFWNARNRGQLVKSPVEFVVGTLRVLQVDRIDPLVLVRGTHQMGMRLYEPPTVQGWPGGQRWITAQTLLARNRFAAQILRDDSVDLSRATAGLDRAEVLAALVPDTLRSSVATHGDPLAQALRSAAWNLA